MVVVVPFDQNHVLLQEDSAVLPAHLFESQMLGTRLSMAHACSRYIPLQTHKVFGQGQRTGAAPCRSVQRIYNVVHWSLVPPRPELA